MGYCIYQQDQNFFIKKEDFDDVIGAIKSLKGEETIDFDSGPPHFSWVSTENFMGCDNIEGIFYEWRWQLGFDNDGNADSIYFEGEKLGDDIIFLNKIAKYVDNGSPYYKEDCFIEMRGEDGDMWRWVFVGDKCIEVYARISYPY